MTTVTDREALLARFQSVRHATEALAAPLSPEDQVLQSMPNASPTKWHRAHTAWFFEEFILGPRGVPPVSPAYRFLFNSYYEAVGPRHPRSSRGMLSRPSTDEIAAYRRAVDGRMTELLAGADETALAALAPMVELGLAHEEQHQELLLTDILHALHQNPQRPAYRTAEDAQGAASAAYRNAESRGVDATAGAEGAPEQEDAADAAAGTHFVALEGGLVTIGDDGRQGFAFDNERPEHKVWLEPFALASQPITWGEVAAFVSAHGYADPALWLAEGFDFVRAHAITAPLYAEIEPGSVRAFTLDGMVELDLAAPAAHLSYYEADALAQFLGGRLPSEAEWEVAARAHPSKTGNFRESGALRPTRAAQRGRGPVQLFGDVWEWTASAYAPYPGFSPAAGAVGEYNGKFMINQQVLRGGSCFTPRGHVRASYRNFWHADTRFQMAGARIAKPVS